MALPVVRAVIGEPVRRVRAAEIVEGDLRGGERRPAALRDALTRSGRRLPRGYRPVKIRMRDGRAIEGLVKNEDSFSLQVLGARDLQLHLLDRSDAVEVIYSDRSLMPSDYAQRLTAAEIDDLLAFLSRQVDGRPQP